ncbi:hypothetical protein K491DRAFT_711855 [Lophiostoma macrostomum CBS 122681]|uniref:Metallo-beta-lactamase domain-containing protein n=1 Tax=Lophiostoma macrostomum CBS 122681 TaxID=1314788 RepID=A0A6A6TK03_9PLEO|nr:hypothetical protein K491DRAFT_711855 [Lophiostoma macrostomum CBS 122681]
MSTPTASKLDFGQNIVNPLAQITVVESDEGDCNVVDFCGKPFKTNREYQENSWRRTIIDTGPSNKNIVRTLCFLAVQQGVPTIDGNAVYGTPKVHELQITHPDNDHIGNASAFLKQMVTSKIKNIVDCTVSYCRIPDVAPEIRFDTQSQKREIWSGDKKSVINSICYEAQYTDSNWDADMRLAGFEPRIDLIPDQDDWDKKKIKTGGLGYEWQRDGTDRLKNLFGTDVSGVINPVAPPLRAKITIFESAFGRFEVTLIKDPKTGKTIAKLHRNRNNMANVLTEVPVNQETSEALTAKRTMSPLKFEGRLKKNKFNDPVGLARRALPLMALPRAVGQSVLTDTIDVSKRKDWHFDSVRQVVQLGDDISDLNQTFGFNPKLKTNVPKTGDKINFLLKNGTIAGRIETRGPNEEAYALMTRQIILARLHLHGEKIYDPNFTLDGETVNRSSVVTVFERRDTQGSTIFSMLFTGDAFDHACDITHTMMAWHSRRTQPVIQFDVLKIPHHGSDNTTSSSFYSYCRAYVYLICGDHRNNHGNPKLSSLLAIIKGFKGLKAPGGQPFRIFFSNAHAKDEYKGIKSCIQGLLDGDATYHPNQASSSDYYFEIYYTKDLHNDKYAAFGVICFGKNMNNELVTQWDQNQWVKV